MFEIQSNLKVVPKIIFPETSAMSSQQPQQQATSTSSSNHPLGPPPPVPPKPQLNKPSTNTTTSTTTKPAIPPKRDLKPITSSSSSSASSGNSLSESLKKRSSSEQQPTDNSDKIESIVSQLLGEMIEMIELQSLDSTSEPVAAVIVADSTNQATSSSSSSKWTNNLGGFQNAANQQHLIDACLTGLKHLCHTFAQSHLFQTTTTTIIESDHHTRMTTIQDENTSNNNNNELVNKSFASLFYTSSDKRPELNFRDESELELCVCALRTDCLAYLHSFQILNKLLIKILFFPRETPVQRAGASSPTNHLNRLLSSSSSFDDDRYRVIAALVDEFEDWVKDLFVISCSSTFPGLTNCKLKKINFIYFIYF